VVVTSGSIVQTIVASGHVESPHRISLSAQVTGTVSDVPVVEGQAVIQGQKLLQLEDSEAKSALKQAQAALQQAQSNLRQLRELKLPVAEQAQIQGEANLESAQNNLMRSMDLYDKGFIGAAAKDEAQRAFRIAQSQLSVVQHQSMSLQEQGSELAMADAAVSQAQATVELAMARWRYHHIRSPRSGLLINRNVEVGDGVQPGKTLMTLSPEGSVQLVLQIDERNIKWLRHEQMAHAIADAFPDKKFMAKLVYINPGIDPQRGSVTVKLQVLNPPIELKQDMTVSVDIEIQRADQALLIPMSAVHDEETPSPWVLQLRDGKKHKQFITLGMQSQGHAQVLSGLKVGDMLVP
jgi:HlyD family secretion protein